MGMHTPGPWNIVNGCNIYTDLGAYNAEGIKAIPTDGWMIADCDAGSLSYSELVANTMLISKAPELLEMCETLLKISESWIKDRLEGTSDLELSLSGLKPARDLIAKAKGVHND